VRVHKFDVLARRSFAEVACLVSEKMQAVKIASKRKTVGLQQLERKTMDVGRNSWLLNVAVASGWLLLVASIGIALSTHHLALAHGALGKVAVMLVFIAAISWLGARESRLTKVAATITLTGRPMRQR
jgi:hypothetical protein